VAMEMLEQHHDLEQGRACSNHGSSPARLSLLSDGNGRARRIGGALERESNAGNRGRTRMTGLRVQGLRKGRPQTRSEPINQTGMVAPTGLGSGTCWALSRSKAELPHRRIAKDETQPIGMRRTANLLGLPTCSAPGACQHLVPVLEITTVAVVGPKVWRGSYLAAVRP
jgi:hypothetical protein